jgi:cystathionine gamma-synthase
MSALYTTLEIIYKLFPEKPTLQIGFPYVDVLKLPMNIFHGAKLITEEDCKDIELEILRINPAALIIELPSNPMLKCVNIKKISKIANKLNIPVIVDDTIGSNLNINSLEHADIVFTSLTKIFSGSGDILAGSLILNPKSRWIDQFRNALKEINLPILSDGDIVSLEKVSRDVKQRVFEQNKACLELKKRLETHKEIKNIFHPENCPNFNSILTSDGGYGCLLSFELKGGREKAKKFYDSLQISKGPSLGTKFTLVCPYVLLAHYDELEWAESFGIPSHLLRVSVGIEDKDHLWSTFSEALNNF